MEEAEDDTKYLVDKELVMKLSRMEQATILTKKQSVRAAKSGLQRLNNVKEMSKIVKVLDMQPLYMKQHINAQKNAERMRGSFKPKVMLGDLRKPNIEFTSDIVYMAHNTRVVKKGKAKTATLESLSLQQLRKKER